MDASFLFQGMVLGLSAGIAPGPLTVLVITETTNHGFAGGARVAIAPLLTDAPIILACLFVLTSLAAWIPGLIGVVSLVGAGFLIKLAIETWRSKPPAVDAPSAPTGTLKRAIIANLTNPHPYLFWLTIGVPILLKNGRAQFLSTALFIVGMYGTMVATKLAMAAVALRFRGTLNGVVYRRLIQASAISLVIFAGIFLRDGLSSLVAQ